MKRAKRKQRTQPKAKATRQAKQHFVFKIPKGVRVSGWHIRTNDGEGY